MFAPLLICAFHLVSPDRLTLVTSYTISLPVHISPTLIADVLIPRKPTHARPGYVCAAFCGSSPQAAFHSLARPPSHSPSSCTLCAAGASRPPPSPPRTLPTLPS
ncbi:hypothetical protein B0H13DRAFT_2045302 [Mycena leptocephala]|nr:hypothetical protein B0H13DRAFT_2045302 [Mycena leptocephala]